MYIQIPNEIEILQSLCRCQGVPNFFCSGMDTTSTFWVKIQPSLKSLIQLGSRNSANWQKS